MISFKDAAAACQNAWGPGNKSVNGQLGVVSLRWGEDPGVVLTLVDDGSLCIDAYTGMTNPYMNPLSLTRQEWVLDGLPSSMVPLEQAIREASEWRKKHA